MYFIYGVIVYNTVLKYNDFAYLIEEDDDRRIEINNDPLTILRKGCRVPQHQQG